MNEINELTAKYRVEQSKYAYYIVALCVAAIGFSINQTMGRVLHYELWPLGLSVLLFGISVWSGLKFIRYIISGIAFEIDVKEISLGSNEKYKRITLALGIDPQSNQAKAITHDALSESARIKTDWMSFWYKLQAITFYIGIITFLSWRIHEMYLLSL